MLIDTHSHIHVQQFEKDREEVIRRAQMAGVKILINVGFDPAGNEQAAALAQKHDSIYFSCAIHPHEANLATDENLDKIRKIALSKVGKKLVAIGETGLDYFRNKHSKEVQVEAFKKQIKLAKELDLPLIIHCRDGIPDALLILKDENVERAVFHCFTGTLNKAKICWERGFYISFTGICTYPAAHELREIVASSPQDRMMIETDCPFLSPQSKRGSRNEPAYLPEVCEKLAEIRGVSPQQMEKILEENSRRFFNLAS